MRAWLGLRDGVHYRRDAFTAGLEATGYTVHHGLTDRPGADDLLVIWNRYRANARAADIFEARGLPVIVAENGYLGNEWNGQRFYAMARSQHNGAGRWFPGGPERWDGYGITLAPWQPDGGDVLVLPQRGIGPPGVGMPLDWLYRVTFRLTAAGQAYRVRQHPGQGEARPLADDLMGARAVYTWGSGAALKALALGWPVFHAMPQWIGADAGLAAWEFGITEPRRDDAARLEMFRRLAWAQWTLPEIATGVAFAHLLQKGNP